MRAFNGKIFLSSLMLFSMISLLVPTSQSLAAKWGCIKPNGECIDIESKNSDTAAFDCNGKCGLSCANARRLGGCPQFGCIHGNVCDNISAGDYKISIRDCISKYGQDSEARATPCPTKGDWACFKDEKCENVNAGFYQEAQSLCTKGEVAKEKVSCAQAISSDKALEEKYGPLAGTSLEDLQKMAAKKLNQGQISSPTALISRAINLLTAFIGSISLLLYVVAGFLWMTANGASEQVDKAKKILVWTTLGVVVMLASYMLTTTLFDLIPK